MRIAFTVLITLATLSSHAKPLRPTLSVDTGDGRRALQLVAVRIDTTIRGHLARTECELTYRNDLDQIVEGDFSFPLPAGAELTGLGLYFNNRLRHAVAVERERARVAYEATVHQRIDPALAEWSTGNRAELRIYPIPARGEKKVWLSYDQEILSGDYVLDLRWAQRLRSVDVRIDADGRFVRDSFDVTWERPYRLQLVDAVLDRQIVAEGDARTEALTARDEKTGRWYLAAAPRPAAANRSIDPARELIVFRDTSGSAIRQNNAAIDAFLDLLASRQSPGTRMTFIPFDVAVGQPAATMEGVHPIGATNYHALFTRMRELAATAPSTTRFVLVTDGITSLGDRRDLVRLAGELRSLGRPLTVVNASAQADDILLAHIAGSTEGWLLDLNELTPEAAADAAMRAAAPAISAGIAIVQSRRAGQYNARIPLAAASEVKPFLLPLRIGGEERSLAIRELRHPKEIAMVRSAYARAALRQLLLSMASDEELLAHGREFQQLTPRTSLLVLESWRDYERWEVPMPDDVRREQKAELEAVERAATQRPVIERPRIPLPPLGPWAVDGIARDPSGFPLPGATLHLITGGNVRTAVTREDGRARFELSRAPSSFTLRAELPGLITTQTVVPYSLASGSTVTLTLRFSAITESITVTAEAPTVSVQTSTVGAAFVTRTPPADGDALIARLFAASDSENAVADRRATLDAVGAKMATLTSIDERVRYYLTARAAFGGDKAFHVHAATLFRNDAPELAARILSELAEAYPDDAALLRVVARIFEGWNETALARLLLQHAIDVAASEEQTWRELLLLEARLGNGDAIEALVARAARLDPLVRGEIDAAMLPILARWRSGPSEPRDLRLADDSDLQVDLMWDTNFSDVDLHVTEPSGEVVMYSHTSSKQGAKLHDDVTDGYGPELYTLRDPAPGAYEIAVDYYGVDDTEVSFETLAHLIVHRRTRSGIEREEFILLLSNKKERRVVARIAF